MAVGGALAAASDMAEHRESYTGTRRQKLAVSRVQNIQMLGQSRVSNAVLACGEHSTGIEGKMMNVHLIQWRLTCVRERPQPSGVRAYGAVDLETTLIRRNSKFYFTSNMGKYE